jgi:hypothetical protein
VLKLVAQYALAGLLGVLARAGTIVSDDLVAHQTIDWLVVIGESIKVIVPLLPTLAIAMHLNDIGTAKAAREPRLRLRQPPEPTS